MRSQKYHLEWQRGLSPASTLGGGYWNYIDTGGVDGTISGGERNYIAPGVEGGTIPGGMGLTAQSLTQFVAGRFNIPQGTSNATIINPDDFLVIYGNGTTFTKSNAWTLSNSGYSTAYDTIGSANGGVNPTVMGSTYARNSIIAWGNAIPASMTGPDSADIGVKSIKWHPATNQYDITLNVNNPDGSMHVFRQGESSVVASINQGLTGTPGIIAVTSVEPSGVFHVTTWPQSSTTPTNTFGFMFQVVAR